MNLLLFIDTSALIALVHPQDQYHDRIRSYFRRSGEAIRGVTSSLVLSEFLTFFSRHGDLRRALDFYERILENRDLKIIWVDRKLHQESSKLLLKYADQGLSFTDAASVAVMKRERLTQALAFDDDFVKVGFQTLP
ncbi:MAG: PIN domain-containing protein [Deltaproteobacteria bacterium]|nr:PIN domain-containing protein [Deltaproteobacteria bacterium]